MINKMKNTTAQFLKTHSSIVVIRSDKGNKTVIMYKEEYRHKALEHLSDDNNYQNVNEKGQKLTRLIEINNNKLVDRMLADGSIDSFQATNFQSKGGISPRIYMSVKTHKQNQLVRPVVSTPGSHTYKLTAFIQEILATIAPDTTLKIRNSTELKKDIAEIKLSNDDVIVTFDVVSLYTNALQNKTILVALKRWSNMKTTLRRERFEEALTLCVSETF